MKVLIKSARIIQSGTKSPRKVDILIENGVIKKIANSIRVPKNTKIISSKKLCVSPGWFDMRSHFRDPGEEVKETITTGASAAAAGGFTGVLLMPSTNPVLQSKADIEYILKRSALTPIDIYPAGALSRDLKGNDLTEMHDMSQAGALAFTDDKNPVTNSGMMLRALQYCRNIDSLVISYANDPGIVGSGQVNEGYSSTVAGFKGAPSLSEEIFIGRDLQICKYADGTLHFACVTTAGALKLIKEAKKSGLKVTCEVTAHHLYFDDSMIESYDTNFKVKPPLRSLLDVKALRKAVKDGVVDVICSDHSPQDTESKNTEFDYAGYGVIGLETAYPAANMALDLEDDQAALVKMLSVNPRKILGLDVPVIKEGEKANITIFDPSIKWEFTDEDIVSMSHNSPFVGCELRGKVLGIINKGKLVMNKQAEVV
jgi:dihydroorotase